MATETKETQKPEDNLPALRPARLPYHPIIKKEFGYDEHAWKALVEAIFPAAQTPESIRLALSYCKARNLDPFKRCIHIVPIWDSKKKCMVDTVWPGIGELRTTAHRTGVYAGRDKTEFGPLKQDHWGGGNDKVTVTFPEWAQVTVYRIVKGERVAYAGPQIYWLETFASVKSGAPNSMWCKRPRGQLDKCAEAAALRAAFPEEVGNDYIDAEAHSPAQRKGFEEAQTEATKRIEAEAGSEPIDTSFEADEPAVSDEDATATKAKADAEKAEKKAKAKVAREAKKKNKDKLPKYHCPSCKPPRDFDEDVNVNDEGKMQCPKCLNWNVETPNEPIDPDIAEENN